MGEQAALNADVNGTQPMTYQWYKDGEELPTTNSTHLNNLQLTDAGQYLLKASNAYGVKDSQPATVSVGYTLTIAKDPEDITTTVGSIVLMSVDANGTAPFTYEWSKDFVVIPEPLQPNTKLLQRIYSMRVSTLYASLMHTAKLKVCRCIGRGPAPTFITV